ncbi:hypothetical protein D9M73_164990 [compost metagenome]
MLRQQCCQHIIGVSRLAQVVAGTALDRLHCGGNARVPGQDHHAHFRVQFQQLGQQHQAGVAIHLQVQRGVVRQVLLGQNQAFFGRTGSAHTETATAHGPGHDPGKGGVVIYQQQVWQLFAFNLDFITHHTSPRASRGRRSSVSVPPSS